MLVYEALKKLEGIEPQLRATVVPVPGHHNLYALCGWQCFSGSMKGITAYSTIRNILSTLNPNDSLEGKILIEGTSGGQGLGVAAIAEYLEIECHILVSEKITETTLRTIRMHKACVERAGRTTIECYRKAQMLCEEDPGRYMLVGQLDNSGNPAGHQEFTTPLIPENIDDVYIAMGSGGGALGVCRGLNFREIVPSVFVSISAPGETIVGTFSEDKEYETPFIKSLRKEKLLTEEVTVTALEAIQGMKTLRQSGIHCGMSGGGVFSTYLKRKQYGHSTKKSLLLLWDGADRWMSKL